MIFYGLTSFSDFHLLAKVLNLLVSSMELSIFALCSLLEGCECSFELGGMKVIGVEAQFSCFVFAFGEDLQHCK